MQLEARNPTPEPNEARAALGGAWRLVYTSNSELIALLALGRLPLVTVGEVTQGEGGRHGRGESQYDVVPHACSVCLR